MGKIQSLCMLRKTLLMKVAQLQTNAAGSTKVVAGRDVINKGVQYEAGNSKVEWNSSNNRRETITGVDQGRIGGAGQTTVVAGRDAYLWRQVLFL